MIYDDLASSAMNYYEELGVAQDATEQEIRKAHRRLVKLMHPDAQPDQSMKMLAETQMRRLNSIVSTLLDSEQRRTYDEQLQAASHQPTYKHSSGIPTWRGIPWWLASAVGAVVLTLAAVWLWADHLGNGFSNRRTTYIPPVDPTPVISKTPPARNAEASEGTSFSSPPGPDEQSPVKVSDPPRTDTDVTESIVADPPAVKKKEEPKATPHVEEKQKPAVMAVNQPTKPAQKAPAFSLLPDNGKIDTAKTVLPPPVKTTAKVNTPTQPIAARPPIVSPAVKPTEASVPTKNFNLPPGAIARARPASKGSAQLPPPPGVIASNRDYSSTAMPPTALPTAEPPKAAAVISPNSTGITSTGASSSGPRDPLEGEWVYAPKEPERQKPGFYPPEFIDLKLFGAGDTGNLRGQYSAKYVVTDKPVAPEVTFELASAAKGSRRFNWQSSNGARGTMSIDPIDERTIRIDWRTTTAVRGPALTQGSATLVRRQ